MRVLLVAGEPSGDAHGARVARRLVDAGAAVDAVGGPALETSGATLLASIDRLAVLGFVEVARALPQLVALRGRLERCLRSGAYDLYLGVDYPGFNLRMEARARRHGVPVLHYIGPQIWAWRAHRLGVLRRVANHVALVLPFEKPLYDAAGVAATWVGHPLCDEPPVPDVLPDHDLGLFPGSREQEVRRHVPLLLDAVALLAARRPGLRALLSRAPGVSEAALRAAVARHAASGAVEVAVAPARSTLARCRASLVASGTATLEAALAGRPFAVFYRTGRMNYALARRLVRVGSIGLVNLVAAAPVVREYVQDAAQPAALAAEAERLLDDPDEIARQRAALGGVAARLGPPGAAARVADLALGLARAHAGSPAPAAAS